MEYGLGKVINNNALKMLRTLVFDKFSLLKLPEVY